MKAVNDSITLRCIIKDIHDDIIQVVTVDGRHFNLDQLINRIRFNDIIAFASNTTDSPAYKLVPKEIGRKQTLRSTVDENFRLESMPECVKEE